ncbi:hypothetical protein N878_26615 [Pseudomonas sp. EGD-AK9]|nr:hypothetical protein N878_26615 [Pseudomonas sp. EGD-AK9]
MILFRRLETDIKKKQGSERTFMSRISEREREN